ncbi:MAG: DUF6361 family protein [Microthrixaceae bacterium]
MASAIGWLDQSEQQQRKMREIIALFAEPGTIDDIGIGPVRDAFSDLLFPGLSTVQTRIRYLLFVPWVYQRLEAERVPSSRAEAQARQWEIDLIYSLVRGGEKGGVIGGDAKDTLKYLPSVIYWGGLRSFGIRAFTGTRGDYFSSMDRFLRSTSNGGVDSNQLVSAGVSQWHVNLPAPPEDLWNQATLDLTADEARYLQERMLTCYPTSLLAHFARNPAVVPDEARFAWDAVNEAELHPDLAKTVGLSQFFSEVIHGAALLYNLMLAEAAQRRLLPDAEARVARYRELLDEWAGLMAARRPVIDAVQRTEFWEIVAASKVNVGWPVQRFVNLWLDAVNAGRDVVDSVELRTAIHERERQLKKSLARLSNPRALETWRGDAGMLRFDYRWSAVGKAAVNDLARGLGVG